MRLSPSFLAASAVSLLGLASCSTPTQPIYADLSYQVRCTHLDGTPISGCTSPGRRDIFGFNGDMGARFSCTTTERAGNRSVSFTVSARDATGRDLGVSLQNANVAATGGPVTGTCQFTFTDGNTYGGNCAATAPSATQPCQVSSIQFTTDTDTGLPLTNVSVLCIDAPSMPVIDPPLVRGVSSPESEAMAMQIHFYSCPVIQR